jgi:putative ABC transport system permease protein
MEVSLQGQAEMVGPRREMLYRELLEQIGALPGVTRASAINHLPLAGDLWNLPVHIEGRPLPRPGEGIAPAFRVCFSGYFATMGARILQGRDFNALDTEGSTPVVIINERFAAQHWPGADPAGQRITFDNLDGDPVWRTIVGVVGNVKQRSWTDAADEEIYLPFTQSAYLTDAAGHYSMMSLVVRTEGNPTSLASAAQEAVWSLNRSAPVSNVATLNQVVGDTLSEPRFTVVLIDLFAGLALLLGTVGIYGVMAFTVTQRTQEIGIRIALGAQKRDVLGLVVGQGMRLTLAGAILGLAAAGGLSQVLTNLLFEVRPLDPLTFAAVTVLLVAVVLTACWLPARRAASVNPMEALRSE